MLAKFSGIGKDRIFVEKNKNKIFCVEFTNSIKQILGSFMSQSQYSIMYRRCCGMFSYLCDYGEKGQR